VKRAGAWIAKVNERAAQALHWIYKHVLAPSLHASMPGACPFQPTCSDYAALAVAEHGLLRGGMMAAWRVLRCHPLSRGGFDPVPAKTGNREQGTGNSQRGGSDFCCEWTGAQVPGSR
jgi:uncharacterized protein